MILRNLRHVLKLLTVGILSTVFILGCDGCDDNTQTHSVANYTLDIQRYQNAAPEVYLDSSLVISGTLTDLNGNELANERVVFTVSPDSLGNMSPPDYALTNPGNPGGFVEEVKFIARELGSGMIYGRFYSGEILAAQDTLHIVVKEWGNE